MLIRDWMPANVITVTADTAVMNDGELVLKDHDVRRLPVVDDNGCGIGIVAVGDMKAASPSRSATLDMNVLYYLLFELTIKDIMMPAPITAGPPDTVEHVALLMPENGFFPGGLPVVDAGRHWARDAGYLT